MKGSILLQFIVIVSIIYIVITLPEAYEIIRLVLVVVPFLIIANIVKMVVSD